MLNPANVDLVVWRGGTYDTKIEFWQDAAHTVPYSLAGKVVTLKIDGGPSLAEGGFGITVTSNEVVVKLTPVQSQSLAALTRAHFSMKWVEGEKVDFPIHGTMSFEEP